MLLRLYLHLFSYLSWCYGYILHIIAGDITQDLMWTSCGAAMHDLASIKTMRTTIRLFNQQRCNAGIVNQVIRQSDCSLHTQ